MEKPESNANMEKQTELATFGAGCFWGVEPRFLEVDESGRWLEPAVTTVDEPLPSWRAEEYHQRYLEKNGLGHCSI
jgi:peptide methionine sulfoxide reductase MsrA